MVTGRPDRGGKRRGVGAPVGVSGTRSTPGVGFARTQRGVRSHRQRYGSTVGRDRRSPRSSPSFATPNCRLPLAPVPRHLTDLLSRSLVRLGFMATSDMTQCLRTCPSIRFRGPDTCSTIEDIDRSGTDLEPATELSLSPELTGPNREPPSRLILTALGRAVLSVRWDSIPSTDASLRDGAHGAANTPSYGLDHPCTVIARPRRVKVC
jgi:hypothetical protein